MIDIEHIKNSLDGAVNRYDEFLETMRWFIGPLGDIPRELLPAPEGDAGQQALSRLAKMAVSSGNHIYQQVRDGIVGEVNWGGKSEGLDERLEELDLRNLAEKLVERGLISGFMAGVVNVDEEGVPTISRLGGYVEPLTDPYDYDRVVGVVQIMRERSSTTTGTSRYTVRVYDLQARVVHVWKDVSDMSRLGPADEELEVMFPPRVYVLQTGSDGHPIGDMQRVLPLVKSEWASQVRGDRVEEATGFPQAVVKGDVLSGVDKRGPTNIIELSADGEYAFVLPGDLSQIHEHHDRKLHRLRESARLPAGSLGAQTPSAEALREAAVKFVQMCNRYARALSAICTELVDDLAEFYGAHEVVPVVVTIDREVARQQEIESVLELWEAGLMPFGEAVRAVSVYVPTWSSSEVEAWVEEQEGRESAEDIRKELLSNDLYKFSRPKPPAEKPGEILEPSSEGVIKG